MEFIVAFTFITWLLVVIVTLRARPAQTIYDAKREIRKKEHRS